MTGTLAERLIERSELHGEFVLSSGETSTVYFDKTRFLTDPALLAELSDAVVELLPGGLTHLASPEGAAMLLLAPVALRAGLPMAVVRKKAKDYGTRSQVEGEIGQGDRVALIEDVSTTGGQTKRAAEALEGLGVTVAVIILTIDRGGADHLREAGYEVRSIVSLRPTE